MRWGGGVAAMLPETMESVSVQPIFELWLYSVTTDYDGLMKCDAERIFAYCLVRPSMESIFQGHSFAEPMK